MGFKSKGFQKDKKQGGRLTNNFCPICKCEFKDILKHFSINHDIKDIEQLSSEVEKAEQKDKKVKDYGDFISEINSKLGRKEITIEEWKNLRDNWNATH
ncbi:MAG: hypothetical protein HY394_03120 [Candidatus Diapherotrites archaeon]|nr:hypothetical protein [Candidatus Diapherotrites archaeon]